MLEFIYENQQNRSVTFTGVQDGVIPDYLLVGIEGIHGVESEIFDYAQYMQPGSTFVGSQMKPRTIRIIGRIYGNIIENRINLLEVFNTNVEGVLTLKRGDFIRRIDCVPVTGPKFPNDNGWIFTLQLFCANPFWRADDEMFTDIAIWEPSFHWPLTIPEDIGFVFGTRTIQSMIVINNTADAEVGFKIIWKAIGGAQNPRLVDGEDDSRFIQANVSMYGGDVIEVSTEKRNMYARLIKDGVVSNIFGHMEPGSTLNWQLRLGHNYFRFEAGEGGDLIDSVMYYRFQYLGV
jgi:hypothetical protein